MKKFACFLLALFLVMSSAYAGFTFSFGPHEPLYNPTTLDPYGFDGSRLKVFYMTDSNHMGNNIMIHDGKKQPEDEGYYRIVDYRDFSDDFRLMLNLRMSLGTSVLRFGWPEWFLADFVVQGSLNTVFVLAGGTDNLGFDGSIFAGGEVRLFDMFSLKAGIRHYSGHTGDEIIGDAMGDVGHTNWGVVDYVRDNMLEFGLGYDGIEYFDIWCSFIMPQPGMWWAPYFHQPDWIHTTGGNPTYTPDRNPGEWAVRGPYGDGYGAYIIQLDANVRYPFLDKYEIYGSVEMKFHQDGMTMHTLTPTDDTDKWEMEISAALGFTFSNVTENMNLSFELGYHNGRFPLLNFFWKRIEAFSFAIRLH